ncbi:hypothetical protein [Arenibacter palladensis]|uniref:hypothetical protein n=1 Tax=Arenibacter palladensis TaxID=237373 RepID=UPI0026E27F19|nr:hypothetical protein [Arenibacter palladensis]MDO6603169.1 hypothetical protein [Arenibacter palladensis]
MKTNKKKLKALNDIHKRHQKLMLLLNQQPDSPTSCYRVSLEVSSNNELLLNITSLLEVCVLALDGNGILLSPNNQNVAKQDSVCRVLELVLNMLPHSQMDFMDFVTEKLNGLKIPNNNHLHN